MPTFRLLGFACIMASLNLWALGNHTQPMAIEVSTYPVRAIDSHFVSSASNAEGNDSAGEEASKVIISFLKSRAGDGTQVDPELTHPENGVVLDAIKEALDLMENGREISEDLRKELQEKLAVPLATAHETVKAPGDSGLSPSNMRILVIINKLQTYLKERPTENRPSNLSPNKREKLASEKNKSPNQTEVALDEPQNLGKDSFRKPSDGATSSLRAQSKTQPSPIVPGDVGVSAYTPSNLMPFASDPLTADTPISKPTLFGGTDRKVEVLDSDFFNKKPAPSLAPEKSPGGRSYSTSPVIPRLTQVMETKRLDLRAAGEELEPLPPPGTLQTATLTLPRNSAQPPTMEIFSDPLAFPSEGTVTGGKREASDDSGEEERVFQDIFNPPLELEEKISKIKILRKNSFRQRARVSSVKAVTDSPVGAGNPQSDLGKLIAELSSKGKPSVGPK